MFRLLWNRYDRTGSEMMTPDEQIAVIKAHHDGKPIEWRNNGREV